MIEIYRQLAEQRMAELQRSAAEYAVSAETISARCWTWLSSLATRRARRTDAAAGRDEFDLAG